MSAEREPTADPIADWRRAAEDIARIDIANPATTERGLLVRQAADQQERVYRLIFEKLGELTGAMRELVNSVTGVIATGQSETHKRLDRMDERYHQDMLVIGRRLSALDASLQVLLGTVQQQGQVFAAHVMRGEGWGKHPEPTASGHSVTPPGVSDPDDPTGRG